MCQVLRHSSKELICQRRANWTFDTSGRLPGVRGFGSTGVFNPFNVSQELGSDIVDLAAIRLRSK